jgi:hypothetical protein
MDTAKFRLKMRGNALLIEISCYQVIQSMRSLSFQKERSNKQKSILQASVNILKKKYLLTSMMKP